MLANQDSEYKTLELELELDLVLGSVYYLDGILILQDPIHCCSYKQQV